MIAVVTRALSDSAVEGMVANACRIAVEEGFGGAGDLLVIVAGMPFGMSGSTNMLRIARIG